MTKDTNPARITDDAHSLIVKESARRKLSRKYSAEEVSFKFLISEAIKQIYGDN